MFWGLIMEPNKRYTQVVEKPFHISQAAMDISLGDNDACQVMVVVNGKNFLICTLQRNRQIQVPLDLYFKSGDSVSFLINGNVLGKSNIHLTGYLDPEFQDDVSEDGEEVEEEEEVPDLVPGKNKRKLKVSSEGAPKKKTKQEKKGKKLADDSSDEDEDGDDQLQKLLDGDDIDSDENDESYKLNTTSEADSDAEQSDDEADEEVEGKEEDDDEEEEADDDDDDEEEENESQADSSVDNSKEEAKLDTSNLSKSQKKRLKKKLAQQAKEKPQLNGVDKGKKAEPQKAKEDKKKAEKELPAEKKEKKSLSGGVNIEDTKVGAGAVAKPGKQVMVYYEGRLKSNNKMFDNCIKGPGFKFRLGAKEVISGWDVGINGMKVGGKRRIICPPAMAYGAKGSPPVIPPNSTLVFDVELKNVK